MSIAPDVWLDSAACHSTYGKSGPGEDAADAPPMRLSDLQPHQKRELAKFALAAATTCAFLLTPLMMTAGAIRELPASAHAMQFATPPLVKTSISVATLQVPAKSRPARSRRVAGGLAGGDATDARAQGQAQRAVLPAVTLKSTIASIAGASAEARQTDSRRVRRGVSRVLFGDGRYRARPFPSPAADQD